jgi:ketosteroid isomerase-like protein
MTDTPAALAHALLTAFAGGDRVSAERLIASDFSFTSPLDNAIDRDAYFRICWPNSASIRGFEILRLVEHGDAAIVSYVGRMDDGKRFQNTEVLTCRDGRITAVEVYFGWSIPHPGAPGTHSDTG